MKRCLVNCFSLAELFQRFWSRNSQTIFTRLVRHHIQRFSASGAAALTQSNFCTSWIGIALALVKQCFMCIQIFGSLSSGVIKCWAGSRISRRISRYINLKLTCSIVFVRHNDVRIQQFSIYIKLSKTRAFEKLVLSVVVYGGYLTCITPIAFTINARYTRARGLCAMKCITICSDMNIWHFKHRFLYANNTSLIQIRFKVNMPFFFLSVYNECTETIVHYVNALYYWYSLYDA